MGTLIYRVAFFLIAWRVLSREDGGLISEEVVERSQEGLFQPERYRLSEALCNSEQKRLGTLAVGN
jgi:hypothetical protein